MGEEFSAFEQDCVEPEVSNCLVENDICVETEFFKQTFLPSTRDCGEYFMCYLRVLSQWNCPEGDIFDFDLKTCVADDPLDQCEVN